MTHQYQVIKVYPNAYIVQGLGGFRIIDDTVKKVLGFGTRPNLAWKDAYNNLYKNNQ